ncbi:tail fiber protein [Herbaspirillum seropedicae]|uniref:phage tail protein n=1 Tax=Herbaspirillum seropedicae TaxID=964 RepID=UPI003F8D66AD
MPASYLHGVETIEIDKGPRPVQLVKTAVIGIVGTAAAGPVNTPILVSNERDFAQFGEDNREPTGAETALLNPQQLAPIASGLTVSPTQIRMSAIFGGEQYYVIREVGLWAGSPGSAGAILVAYWSQATGDLAVKSPGVDFVFSHDMSIDSAAPGANLTIVADTAQAPLLALLAEHERKPDPHPQYLTEPRLRPLLERVNTTWSTSGVAPVLSITPATPVSSYVAGQRWRVRFHAGGTGNDTLSVSGLAGKSLKQYDAYGAKIAAVIVAGLIADVEYDGVDVVVLDSLPGNPTPAGQVSYFARSTAPTGYLKANGAAVSRTSYAALFAAIGTTFGAGDGSSTFHLPDLRGEFIRGVDEGRGADAGRVLGSWQVDQFKSHVHGTIQMIGDNAVDGVDSTTRYSGDHHNESRYTDPTGGNETRPRNVALLACIKF